jgi:methylenetetrahydrofolate reductase (NADPH)
VHDFKSLVRFAANCQAQVPTWVHERFEPVLDKPEEARKIATEMLIEQAEDLTRQGVPHIHFYCLNKAGITTEACKALGY